MPLCSQRIWAAFTAALIYVTVMLLVAHKDVSYGTIPSIQPSKLQPQLLNTSRIFLYTAYNVRRNKKTYLRIFTVNKCTKKELSANIDGNELLIFPKQLEGSCPWNWAKGCELNPYVFEAPHLQDIKNDQEISLITQFNMIDITVHVPSEILEDSLSICVPPLFWYTDWTKLIVFVEWWKLQGASKFFFYFQSSSKEVAKVLDYYKREGVAEIFQWPLLPTQFEGDPANDQIYRLGHSLAHNDCLMRAGTKYASLVDIDEMILIKEKEQTVLDYARQNLRGSIRAASFNHHVLVYGGEIDGGFDFVRSPNIMNKKGPKKVVFRVDAVRRMSVHSVNEFWDHSSKQLSVPDSVGCLLHNRYNYQSPTANNLTPIDIFPTGWTAEMFQSLVIQRRTEIFENIPDFDGEIQRILGKCLKNWRSSMGGCKAPVTGCRHLLQDRLDWVEASNSDEVYSVLLT